MRVNGVQLNIQWEDKPANFKRVDALLDAQSIGPGGLIVLPEMFSTGFSMNVSTIAEEEDGPTAVFLRELAAKRQAWVIGGVVRKAENGFGANEALVCSPDGKITSCYRKMHPFSYGNENNHYQPGGEIVTISLGDFTAAPFICYDLRFPELFRHGSQLGADLLIVIACWPASREAHWMTLLQARAIENQAYVIGVNRVGADPITSYSGRSLIINPLGEIIADGGNEETVVRADLDSALPREYRERFPALRDRRREYLV
ncbi:MAG: carbon-nitrogen family hydrolase [bacterium]|nr:carbon-nitrogen family hydrolase [bacterium]